MYGCKNVSPLLLVPFVSPRLWHYFETFLGGHVLFGQRHSVIGTIDSCVLHTPELPKQMPNKNMDKY